MEIRVIFVGGRGNSLWHGQLRLCGSSWECDFYKRINENKENAFQIPLFKNILKCKTRQNDFKMPQRGADCETHNTNDESFLFGIFLKSGIQNLYIFFVLINSV